MLRRLLFIFFFSTGIIFSQPYPDQHYVLEKDSLVKKISSISGMQIAKDGKSLVLSENAISGYTIFEPDSSHYPFDRGLPSWNGSVPNDSSSFKILIRFFNQGWSPWLTAGYWKANIWPSYGETKYSGGEVDVDAVILNSYCAKWQFQVVMSRTSTAQPSPSIHKLSFFVSDQKTTDNTNITSIVNDKPAAIFIDTKHICQYDVDTLIGKNICSPTSVSMVLRSYNIPVDPLKFAKDNYDNYWALFGVWPRVVQNAAQYGLNGSVTRYRTWSDARKVLAAGGRICMSVGKPLYSGHLIMLAGFDSDGNPIVHDPAKSNGYAYKFNKTDLSTSWFAKGGVSYTFFKDDSTNVTSVEENKFAYSGDELYLSSNPNPFNSQTSVSFKTIKPAYTKITVHDITGRTVESLFDGMISSGDHSFRWNANSLPSGIYFIHVVSGNARKTFKALLLK
ncbi:MAG: C39 family peptidase [Bacteroidota bacterium]|nr:C39 family peptidase [Bacteroidota bacterium]